MIIPYSTDAPLYHWPVMTVSLIIINTVVFFGYTIQIPTGASTFSPAELQALAEQALEEGRITEEQYEEFFGELQDKQEELENEEVITDPFVLQYGRGLKPWQWITSNFLHADFFHLLGNMIWLLIFGLIVEGKIGWYKLLAVYLGIGIVECFIEQTLMLGIDPGPWTFSLGASSAIFGVMVIAMLWAPINEVNCAYVFTFGFFFRIVHFSIPLCYLGGFFVVYNVAIAVLFLHNGSNFTPTSELLHSLGGFVGLGVGIAMLRYDLVDCENWDAFSVWQGRHEMSTDQLRDLETNSPEFQAKVQTQVDNGLSQIRHILRQGDSPKLAYRAHLSMKQKYESWNLPDAEFLMIIKQLCDQRLWDDAITASGEYLQQPRSKGNQVRLKLASILLNEKERPSQTIQVLSKVPQNELDQRERQIFRQLVGKARELKEQGVIDTLEDW